MLIDLATGLRATERDNNKDPGLHAQGIFFGNLINVYGHDTWLISRLLGIRPTDFCAFAEVEDATTGNIVIDGLGNIYIVHQGK